MVLRASNPTIRPGSWAQLLGCNLDLISGAQPSTSWLIYQRNPTTEEQKIIDAGIAKITAKNPDALGNVPFVSANDLEGMQDQIDEDSPPSNVASIETGPINVVKQAFTSLAIKTENDSQATKIPAPPPNAPATNKARRAFVLAVNTKILESSQLVANSHLDNGFDDDLSGQEDLKALSPPANSGINNPPTQHINPPASISGPEPKEPIQESIKLRFSIKRPVPNASPSKSASPSPEKNVVKNSKRPSKTQKHAAKADDGIGVQEEGDISVEVKVEPKAKAKAKAKARSNKGGAKK
ncbi:uncharacterized protein MELLADRAFT_96044 [Melampsora larici-populina 98AG31]|uniref:Uncharacterized protein n=1 Tax=Melampsora larici-populina (strain 98AG31 / pathotype 3-4-7) TaxID=747676 RepID=F4SAQ9_MELLP|nr:uncharacterized protein MELLADRAFT_96044 [Melampsora larici-populina 98AG31]EGF98276.1 hypothetical protein MELLADRAFT_96044 [Melampsora larici-populina 98AG31]